MHNDSKCSVIINIVTLSNIHYKKCSTDLTPLHFFFWSHVKDSVYFPLTAATPNEL